MQAGLTSHRKILGRHSQTSLSSRQSASRSFETVVHVPDSDSHDTEEEIAAIRRRSAAQEVMEQNSRRISREVKFYSMVRKFLFFLQFMF